MRSISAPLIGLLYLALTSGCRSPDYRLPMFPGGVIRYESARSFEYVLGTDGREYEVDVFWRQPYMVPGEGMALIQTWHNGKRVARQEFATGNRNYLRDVTDGDGDGHSVIVFHLEWYLKGYGRAYTNTVDEAGLHGFPELIAESRARGRQLLGDPFDAESAPSELTQ